MTTTGKGRLAIGLIGAGRLGRVYARDLASRIAETKLVAIADPVESLAKEVAAEFDVPKYYTDPMAIYDDPAVDAIVIVSPTHTHRELVIAAASRKKPTFCEKPPALSLGEVAEMQDAVAKSGMFLQMGFMRRFDAGYASAKKQIEAGRIGKPLVFKATSRDPFRPSLEYANPKSSGGMLLDMGIHDFDLARWFMGEVRTVSTIGATIAYPELATVGDIDNAIASLTFTSGKLGVVDLTRSASTPSRIVIGGVRSRSTFCAKFWSWSVYARSNRSMKYGTVSCDTEFFVIVSTGVSRR